MQGIAKYSVMGCLLSELENVIPSTFLVMDYCRHVLLSLILDTGHQDLKQDIIFLLITTWF